MVYIVRPEFIIVLCAVKIIRQVYHFYKLLNLEVFDALTISQLPRF